MGRFDEMDIQRKHVRTVYLLGFLQWLLITMVIGCGVYLLAQLDWSHGLRGVLHMIWTGGQYDGTI